MKKLVVAVAGAVLLTQSVHIEAEAPGARGTVAQMQEEKNKCSIEVKEEIYYDSLELLAICVEAEAGIRVWRKENGCRCHFKPGGR